MKREPQSVVMIDGKPVRYSVVKRDGDPYLFIRFRDPNGKRLEKSTKVTTKKAVADVAPGIIAKAYQPEESPQELQERAERAERWKQMSPQERSDQIEREYGNLGGLTKREAMALVYQIDWVSLVEDLTDPEKSIRPGAEACLLHPKEWYLETVSLMLKYEYPTNRDWCERAFYFKVPGMIDPLLGLDAKKFSVLAEVYPWFSSHFERSLYREYRSREAIELEEATRLSNQQIAEHTAKVVEAGRQAMAIIREALAAGITGDAEIKEYGWGKGVDLNDSLIGAMKGLVEAEQRRNQQDKPGSNELGDGQPAVSL